MFQRNVFPYYALMRQINIADFLQNLDAIVVLQFCTVGFFKFALYMFGTIRGIQQLTGIQNGKVLILPSAFTAIFLADTMSSNISEHLYVGLKLVPYFLGIPFFYFITLCSLRGCLVSLHVRRIEGNTMTAIKMLQPSS
jgi:spore germination protein KB